MRVITGKSFNIDSGHMVVPNEQGNIPKIGETVLYNGEQFIVRHFVFSSKPDGGFAVQLDKKSLQNT